MGTFKLTKVEELLCAAIQHGDRIQLGEQDKILADVLRHIVVGLPLVEDEEGVWTTITSLFRAPTQGVRCQRTGVGIRIEGGVIDGRLDLASVTGEDGGLIGALEFKGTRFEGGFSGAHGRFSRLSFRNCTFADHATSVDPVSGNPLATIDLSDAVVGGDLDLRHIRPDDEKEGLLWIRAPGVGIDGEIDLSRALLRAPRSDRPRRFCEERDDALNLAMAEIRGDIWFLNGSRSVGRINLRAAHVEGDMWMSGAEIECLDEEHDKQALFLQGARIDGFLLMDGRWDYFGARGPYRRFRCKGELNLRSTRVGRDIALENAVVQGAIEGGGLSVTDDFVLGADVTGDIDLTGCRIGGTLDIADLSLAATVKRFSLKEGNIGRSLKLISSEAAYRLIGIRSFPLQSLPGAELIETLWRHEEPAPSRAGKARERDADSRVPIDRQLAQAGFLRHRGIILHLDRHADLQPRVATWFDGDGRDQAIDLLGLCQPYAFANPVTGAAADAAAAAGDNPVRFKGGVILLPHMAKKKMAEAVRLGNWITEATLTPQQDLPTDAYHQELLSFYVQPRALLQGDIDLENLSCDMLDDEAGRGWGTHLDRIEMNHFSYNRTTWECASVTERRGLTTMRVTGFRRRLGKLRQEVATRPFAKLGAWAGRRLHKWGGRLKSRFKRLVAERTPVWLAWLVNCSEFLRIGQHWTAIERKRNWIYRQFDTAGLASSSKYRVRLLEYRSQPFEQVIKVARLEGREDYALYFEILKERIEWDIFISRNRGWFLLIGIGAYLLWLSVAEGMRPGAAIVVIVALALLPTFANWVMYRGFGYLRRPIRAICTLIVAFLLGWWGVSAANDDGMLVVDVAPVASIVGDDEGAAPTAEAPPKAPAPAVGPPAEPVIGSQRVARGSVAYDVRCGRRVNEALYALDVLIPLIDLRQENRCEVGLASGQKAADHQFERWFFRNPSTLWAVLKALYAIAGWFIVSLAILTFAHVTRSRGAAS